MLIPTPNQKVDQDMIGDLSTIYEVVVMEKSIEKESCKKMAKKEDPFPFELWIEILCRSPVKSLMKFRCVSKTMCSIIDDPKFVSLHLNTYKDENFPSVLMRAPCRFRCKVREKFLLYNGDTLKQVDQLAFLIDVGVYNFVVDCINGVVLIHHRYDIFGSIKDSKVILWNPSIKKVLEVPSFPFLSMSGGMKPNGVSWVLDFGFGFYTSQCDPRVVAIFYPTIDDISTLFPTGNLTVYCAKSGSVAIYSPRMDSWRRLDIRPPCWWQKGPQAYLNQAIHWLGTVVWNCNAPETTFSISDLAVVSFDLCAEVFHYMKLPLLEKQCLENIVPAVLDDKLALFSFYSNNGCAVWVMDHYGVLDSWTKVYQFELEFKNFLYLKDAELLFDVRGEGVKLRKYNIKSKMSKCLLRRNPQYSEYKLYGYKESLLLSDLVDAGAA